MAGKARLINLIRRQAYYRPMLTTLADHRIVGWAIQPPTGKGHPMLVFNVGAHHIRVPLPGSPSGYSEAIFYIPAEIRRRIKQALEH